MDPAKVVGGVDPGSRDFVTAVAEAQEGQDSPRPIIAWPKKPLSPAHQGTHSSSPALQGYEGDYL